MRIIHFSRDYTPHDHRFLSKMVETDHEIFYLRLENAGQPYEDRPLPEGVTNIRWAGGKKPLSWRDGPKLVRDLKRVIREHEPDIIQAGPIQTAALLTALAGFKNLVAMSWGYDLLIDADKGPAWAWATRYTLDRAAAFVGDCETVRDLAVRHGMDPAKIVTFPWGANLEKFTPGAGNAPAKRQGAAGSPGASATQAADSPESTVPQTGDAPLPQDGAASPGETAASGGEPPIGTISPLRDRWGWGPDCFVILSTRSWSSLYGVADLVRAFISAARQRPELRLLMLAGGPLSPRIKAMVYNAGLLDRVQFPGQVSQADLPDYYRAADLYVSTSHSDGTSISLLEALASGLPVLVTDIPGNREWVAEQGQVGWTFKDGDAPELERRLLEIVDRRDELDSIGANARRLAEARGDWDKNFQMLPKAWEMAK